jgi:hypothetical protein
MIFGAVPRPGSAPAEQLIERIRGSAIGDDLVLAGPFGPRRLVITDADRLTSVLRSHGALSCWDYASAGAYLAIDMTGKDAVLLSPHKFVGGPRTPGPRTTPRASGRRNACKRSETSTARNRRLRNIPAAAGICILDVNTTAHDQ